MRNEMIKTLGAVLLGLTLSACSHATADAADPIKVGHRGNGENVSITENTLPAFQYAIDHDADSVEFDMRHSSDGAMVVMHDATLDRTTLCSGPVSSKTLAAIKLCKGRWGGTVPSVRQALSYVKSKSSTVRIHIEMKDDWTVSQVRKIADEVYLQGLQSRVMISSSDKSNLTDLKAYKPAIPRELGWRSSTLPSVSYVKGYGTNIAIRIDQATAPAVSNYQASGITVFLWTGRDDGDYAQMRALGGRGWTVDDVQELNDWLETH